MTRWFSAILIAFALSWVPEPAEAAKAYGAQILDESVRLAKGRYRSRRNWDRTLRFFRREYPQRRGIVWQRIDTPANIKAIHIANTRPRRTWEGINIYQKGNEVFIYVIPADPNKKGKK